MYLSIIYEITIFVNEKSPRNLRELFPRLLNLSASDTQEHCAVALVLYCKMAEHSYF